MKLYYHLTIVIPIAIGAMTAVIFQASQPYYFASNFGIMAFRVWMVLFVVFAAFSWMVYAHCDDVNREGPPTAEALNGWKIWQQKNCQACHQLYGLGGYLGPDLTNVYSDKAKGALYMRAFIQHGTARMPDFNLSDAQSDELISFLAWVDKSGSSKVPADKVNWTGSYDLEKTNK